MGRLILCFTQYRTLVLCYNEGAVALCVSLDIIYMGHLKLNLFVHIPSQVGVVCDVRSKYSA